MSSSLKRLSSGEQHSAFGSIRFGSIEIKMDHGVVIFGHLVSSMPLAVFLSVFSYLSPSHARSSEDEALNESHGACKFRSKMAMYNDHMVFFLSLVE